MEKLEQRVAARNKTEQQAEQKKETDNLWRMYELCDVIVKSHTKEDEDGDKIHEICCDLSALLRLRLDSNEAKRPLVEDNEAFAVIPGNMKARLGDYAKDRKFTVRYRKRVKVAGMHQLQVSCLVTTPNGSSFTTKAGGTDVNEAEENAATRMCEALNITEYEH